MTTPSISIVVPTFNGAATLPALLDAISRQRIEHQVEVVAIDSGSTDGSVELLRSARVRLITIPAATFNHGLTRNLGIDASAGELIVLTVQDAVPASDTWLAALTRPLALDPCLAGTFARQLPRPDAGALTRHYLSRWFASSESARTVAVTGAELEALSPLERLDRCTFDNVCSCIRRSVWQQHPFRETPIGEDVEWAREVLLSGQQIAYVPSATVVHSHERSPSYEFDRTRVLHRRLYELFGVRTIPTPVHLARAIGSCLVTHARCERSVRAMALAFAWPLGQYMGARSAVRGQSGSPVEGGLMRILVVVHGFPPAAQGGSEVYAHAHARTLAALGDDVLVLTREQDPDRPEYAVREDQGDGLRVVRVNNTFRNTRTFEETYANGTIDAIASRIIDDFRPDAAHIHHLTCLSTGIVHLLAARRIPAILTLHDYWLMCHRGQLLDVDYRVCNDTGACASCLGPAGGAGSLQFLGARAVRAIEEHLPAAPAKLVRRAAVDVAAVVSRGRASADRERQRTAHMRAVCDQIAHFIAPSRCMRDRFVAFGVARDRITVADYGFDRDAFRNVARPFPPPLRFGETRRSLGEGGQGRDGGGPERAALRLGFLGSLMVSKAPHVLLEAVSTLPRGSVSVDLYGAHTAYHGDDSYRRQLEPLLDQPDVHMHGPIAHDAVASALASIDVLVVPSIWPENSPLVIHEAFLAGVPVVASRIGGIPELVTDGRNGLLFNARDVTDLSRVLVRLLD